MTPEQQKLNEAVDDLMDAISEGMTDREYDAQKSDIDEARYALIEAAKEVERAAWRARIVEGTPGHWFRNHEGEHFRAPEEFHSEYVHTFEGALISLPLPDEEGDRG